MDEYAALHGHAPWTASLRGARRLTPCRVLMDEQGLVAATLLSDAGGLYVMTEIVARPGAAVDYRALVADVLDLARTSDIQAVGHRVEREKLSPELERALTEGGFVRREERACWRALVPALPDEQGSPLRWVSMEERSFEEAADLLGRVAQGDPDWGGAEPVEELRGYLADPVLLVEPSVVHLGFLGEGTEPVAFACAQVNPRNGWGRISYVGVVPEARGQGLGAWAHRHGFAMLRAQGATRYEGGTSVANGAMNRLFEKHGCEQFRFEIGWRWEGAPASP